MFTDMFTSASTIKNLIAMNIYKYIKYIYFILIHVSVYCIILYYDQQMQNYVTNYLTPTCFDTMMSSSGSLQAIPCKELYYKQLHLKYLCNLARY